MFDDFWLAYPKKCEKIYARQCFDKAVKNGAIPAEIVDGAKKYCAHILAEGTERRFLKNPSTWLNKGCWGDEYEIPVPHALTRDDQKVAQWKGRIEAFNRSGFWPENWGPKPGEPYCEAPRFLLIASVSQIRKQA